MSFDEVGIPYVNPSIQVYVGTEGASALVECCRGARFCLVRVTHINSPICVCITGEHVHARDQIVKDRAGGVLHPVEGNDEMLGISHAREVHGDLVGVRSKGEAHTSAPVRGSGPWRTRQGWR